MLFNDDYRLLDLQLFAEGGDGGGEGDGVADQGVEADSPAAANQTADTAQSADDVGTQPPQPTWNEIKKQYKQDYNAEVTRIVQDRLRGANDYKTKAERAFAIMAQKYGGDPNDIDGLVKAMEDDNSFYEDEALEKGLTVDQLKQIKRLERENEQFRQAQMQQRMQAGARQIMDAWERGADEVRQTYNRNFDLDREIENPEFLRLIKSNVPLKTAYEVCHRDELAAQAMRVAAQKTEEAVVNKIKKNGLRPTENGLGDSTPVNLNVNPKNLTKEQRAEIKRRVRAGEKITF